MRMPTHTACGRSPGGARRVNGSAAETPSRAAGGDAASGASRRTARVMRRASPAEGAESVVSHSTIPATTANNNAHGSRPCHNKPILDASYTASPRECTASLR